MTGDDEIEWACQLAAASIASLAEITTARRTNPAAFPLFPTEATPETLGRRLIGRLLQDGWTPPTTTQGSPE